MPLFRTIGAAGLHNCDEGKIFERIKDFLDRYCRLHLLLRLTNCEMMPMGVLSSGDGAWRIDEVMSSCSFVDDGTVRLEISGKKLKGPHTIARWRGIAGSYDLYLDNRGDLTIVLLSTMPVIETVNDVAGMKLKLRTIDPNAVIQDPMYQKWLKGPRDLAVQEWAEAHSTLK